MTNQEAYKYLSDLNLQWARKDSKTIYVWTPGYICQDIHDIEKTLMQAGMRAISQKFDRICGQTVTYFKHKQVLYEY